MRVIDPDLIAVSRSAVLTDRQREILKFLDMEWSQPRIARFFRLSLRTVAYEVSEIKPALEKARDLAEWRERTEREESRLRQGVTIQQGRRKASWRADQTALGNDLSTNYPVHLIDEAADPRAKTSKKRSVTP